MDAIFYFYSAFKQLKIHLRILKTYQLFMLW